MKPIFQLSVAAVALFAFACGPSTRAAGHGDDDSTQDASTAACVMGSPEVCDDGIDNDCDGLVDCDDPDCSGVGTCPVCGMVTDPQATITVLPDGIGEDGVTCTTDANCAGTMEAGTPTPNCINAVDESGAPLNVCKASYISPLNFIGFPTGATLTDTTKLLNVCATMEHSYLHDLQMELLAPADASGLRRKVILNEFIGQVGPEVYLGMPNDNDEGHPMPGTGFVYCWKMSATKTMDQVADAPAGPHTLPAGDYKPSTAFSMMQDAPLNGIWEIRITDLYPQDNGFLFSWEIAFDPSLVTSCTGPIVE